MAATWLCVPFSVKLPAIMQATLDRHPSYKHYLPVVRWMEVGTCGQLLSTGDLLSSNQDSTYLDATGHSWIASRPTKATAHPSSNWCALLANAKWCCIVNSCPQSKLEGGCSNSTQLMTLLLNGWSHTARKCILQQHLKWLVINKIATVRKKSNNHE